MIADRGVRCTCNFDWALPTVEFRIVSHHRGEAVFSMPRACTFLDLELSFRPKSLLVDACTCALSRGYRTIGILAQPSGQHIAALRHQQTPVSETL